MFKKDVDGATSSAKKIPLILKDFFLLKFGANEESMAWLKKVTKMG
jgi:hypothetical protein